LKVQSRASTSGKPLFANDALAHMFGYGGADDIVALNSIYDLAAPHERERLQSYARARIAEEPAPFRHVHQGIRKDGSLIWVESSGRRVNWDGEWAVQSAVVEVSDQKSAQVELEANERRFRALFDTAPFAITFKDLDGRLVLANRLFCEWYGVTEKAVVGKTLHEFAPARLAETISEMDAEMLDEGQSMMRDLDLHFPDGTHRWVQSLKASVAPEGGALDGILTFGTDVTERYAVEVERRTNQKLEALGQLTGSVAHDFNNMLSVILGKAELLKGRFAMDAPALDDIIHVAKRAGELTQQLLVFSRRRPLDPKALDVGVVVETSCRCWTDSWVRTSQRVRILMLRPNLSMPTLRNWRRPY
jgi:PAS domain S-box-containing protein